MHSNISVLRWELQLISSTFCTLKILEFTVAKSNVFLWKVLKQK